MDGHTSLLSLFRGSVVNLAIELNGQPPLQVYVKPCKEYHITLRSIDMGAMEVIRNYEELQDYKGKVLHSLFRKPPLRLWACTGILYGILSFFS